MEKTPKVGRGCKASPVKITKADGTVEMQRAYDRYELRKVQGHGKKPPQPIDVSAPKKPKKARNRWRVKDGMVTKNGVPYVKRRRRKDKKKAGGEAK